MKCDKAERLLPLLGRGDLKSKGVRALQEHLADCATCGESARDYQRLFDLLHSTAAVDFDDEFFGRIRRSVLSEIQIRERRLPTLSHWWQPKPVTVLGIVVLVMIAFGAGIALLNKVGRNGEKAAIASQEGRPSPEMVPTKNIVKPDVKAHRAAILNPQRSAWNRLSRQGRNVKATQVGGLIAKREDKGRFEQKPQREQINLEGSAHLPSTAPRHEASRIEILTSDPNIRIIWLLARNTN